MRRSNIYIIASMYVHWTVMEHATYFKTDNICIDAHTLEIQYRLHWGAGCHCTVSQMGIFHPKPSREGPFKKDILSK